MNAEIFAEWLRAQGRSVVKTSSSYWYEAGSRVYQAFPYHWLIQPEEHELLNMLHQRKAIALRYSAPIDSTAGCISYHAVYAKPSYTLDGLDRRSRQNIRKGLKNCRVEPISLERLARDGWRLEMDTANRQGRKVTMSEGSWRRRYLSASGLLGFEAWGALVDNRLVASLFTFKIGDCCEMISQQCHSDYLNARVNNALSFVVTKTMIERPEIRSIFYSLESLDAPPSVDQFKFRMGYEARPVRQRVVFHPLLVPFVNRACHAVVRWIYHRQRDNPFLSKLEGMLRFYLKGKCLPISQDWPECLASRKAELLETINLSGGMKHEA